MDKNDFQKLDIERAHINVSVQEARNLVTQWLGADFDEQDEGVKPLLTMASSTSGLGFKVDKPATTPQNTALARLKRTHKPKHLEKESNNVDKKQAASNRLSNRGATNTKVSAARSDARHSAAQDSDSESESESRTTSIKKTKRTAISALDAYRQKKKQKGR